MALGLGSSLVKGGASLLTFVKDNLKLYLDFKSNKSDTLKFPSEGSTEFDGTNDRIDVSATLSSGTYTVMGWVYKTRQDGAYFIDFRKDSGTGYIAFSNNANNSIYSASGTKYINGVEGTTVPLNTWTHVCVSGITISSSTTKIGCQNNDTNFFKGSITNVALWNRELEPEEIQSIMNKSYSQLKGVEKTSLEAWWALDDTVSTEKITNGDFSAWTNDNPDGWTISTDLSGGVESDDVKITEDANGARIYSTGTNIHMTQNVMTIGATYEVTIVVHSVTTGDITTQNLSSNLSINSAGTHTVTTTATATGFRIKRNFPVDMVISSVSVKEVQSNDSKGSNNGAIIGATTTTSVYGGNAPILPRAVDVAKEGQADAIGNGSLTTSSGGYADLGNDSLIQFGNSFSVSCWFKTTDTTASNEMVIAKADDGSSAGWLIRLNSSRKLDFNYVNSASGGVGVTISDTESAVNDGEWYHVAFVHESGVGNRAYKNGILIGSNSTGTDLGSHTPNLHVGNQDYSTPRALDGSFAQVGLWQGALTQAQIQSVMESTSYSKIPSSVKSTLGSSEITNASNTTFSGVTSNDWLPPADVTKSFSNDQMVFTMDDDTPAGYVAQLRADNFSGGSGIPQKFLKVTLDIDSTTTGTYRINNTGGSCTVDKFRTDLTTGLNTIYAECDGANSYFRIFEVDVSTGDKLVLNSFDVKEVTNDIVAYYPLDGSSSRGNGTDDVTTGEVLGDEIFPTSNSVYTVNNYYQKDSANPPNLTYLDTDTGTVTINNSDLEESINISATYKLTFTISGLTSGQANFKATSTNSGHTYVDETMLDNGTHTFYFTRPAGGGDGFKFRSDTASGSSFTISDYSLKKVTSNTGVLK